MEIKELRFAGTDELLIPPKRKRFTVKFGPGSGIYVTLNRLTHVDWSEIAPKWFRAGNPGPLGIGNVDKPRCIEILADKVVEDIEGVIDQNGDPVVVDRQAKISLLTDSLDFFLFVYLTAQNGEAFRKNDDSGPGSSITGDPRETSAPAPSASA